MMSSLLCLRVRQAYLSESLPAKLQTYIVIKFDYVKTSTVVASGQAPLWEQDFIFEVTSESDCIAFELWSKAHDEAAEHLIGALCIPLDHITRIDQSGMICGPGGYGDWYQFDSEFIIHHGCIAGTRGETGHSLLIDAYIEEPFGAAMDEAAAYYYNYGVPPDGYPQLAFQSGSQFQYPDGVSCDSDYTNEISRAGYPSYLNSHTAYGVNYPAYESDYDSSALSHNLSGFEVSVNDNMVTESWASHHHLLSLLDPNNTEMNYTGDSQWLYSAGQDPNYDGLEVPSYTYNRQDNFSYDQVVPDDWSYYGNEHPQKFRPPLDLDNLTPDTKLERIPAETTAGACITPYQSDNSIDLPALDLSSSAPDQNNEKEVSLKESNYESPYMLDHKRSQQIDRHNHLSSPSAEAQILLHSDSPESGLFMLNSNLSPTSSLSNMPRRLPVLPAPEHSMAMSPTHDIVNEIQTYQTTENMDLSSPMFVNAQSYFPFEQQEPKHDSLDVSMRLNTMNTMNGFTPIAEETPEVSDMTPKDSSFPENSFQQPEPLQPDWSHLKINQNHDALEITSRHFETQQTDDSQLQEDFNIQPSKDLSQSPSNQFVHSAPTQILSPTSHLQENGFAHTASVSPTPPKAPSISESPIPSPSPPAAIIAKPPSPIEKPLSRSQSVESQLTPHSQSASLIASPSPSLVFTSQAELKKIEEPPFGVLSPSGSLEPVKPIEPEPEVVQEKTPSPRKSPPESPTEKAAPKLRALSRWHRAFGHVREQIEDNLLAEETDAMPDLPGAGERGQTDFYNQINTSSDLKPRLAKMSHVSELTVAANKRKAEAQSAVITSPALNNEELKMHVYKKTLQALLYPMSKTSGDHKFEIFSAKHPTYCFECEGLLWGLARQGLRCTQCGVKCHDRCKALMNADCLQRAAEKSARQGAHDRAQVFMNIITDLMKKREVEKKDTFELVRKIFNVDQKAHMTAIEQSKQTMLDGASKWSANISVTVVSAQGLMGKDATGTSDPYVTIQLGRTKRRTKTKFKTLNPEWNEKFFFECHNISERIKIRVWDEDDDFKSRLRQKFTRESDDFLGQYIIDVAKLCGDSDIWCNLEKRTDRSMVSGAIRLQISIEIKGEEKVAPYYDQYTCLHENFFHFMYDQPNAPPTYIPPGDTSDAWERYFEPHVQEIVEEFAQRYGIDRIYMAMTHFSCLATKLLNPSVPPLLSDLLAHINVHYAHSAPAAGSNTSGSGTSQSRFNASNFRKEKFTRLLDQQHNSIRLELIDYRNNFPASDPTRLRDLQACVDLLTSINFFRMKVQGLVSPPKASAVVEECIKANMRRTYQFLYDHCFELYQKEFETNDENKTQQDPQDDASGPVLKNLDFWHKLIALVVSVIEEDRNTYGPVLNQFPSVKVGDISALILWQQLADDLGEALMGHEKARQKCKSSEYMNLHFKIKWLYSKYIAVLPDMKDKVAEYPRWFEAFVMTWLNDNDEVSLDCVKSAYERDKRDGFPKTSEQTNFSNSVVDMFSQLTQCHDVIKKLECPDPAIKNVYMARFAKTIEKVLVSYGDFIENDFINFIQDQKITCILLNNMQQTRVNLEKLFELMGGQDLDKNAAEVLNEVQERLNSYLDRLCAMCAEGLSSQIREQIVETAKLLHSKVKGNPANQPLTQPSVIEQIHQDSDMIVQPLMEFLENCISTYADNCDKTILKRMLKELWVVALTNMEKTIVLPPQDAKKISLANLGADSAKDKAKDISSLLLNKVQNKVANVNVASIIQDISRDSERSLSPRQCAVIQAALETIKGYFHADGQGLKMAYLEKSSQLKSLQYALSLYTHTTDMLLKTFVQSQIKQDAGAGMDASGDLNVQIDMFTHPGTGEHKINVKVIACNNLRWSASARPFVCVYLVGPGLAQRKRKWDTKSKTGTLAPVYNESYQFLMGNESEIQDYEIHFAVKDYCFGSDDKTIGMAVVKLADIASAHQGTFATWLPLAGMVRLDDTGYTILRILSQRSTDDVAKEFVKLKSDRRPV